MAEMEKVSMGGGSWLEETAACSRRTGDQWKHYGSTHESELQVDSLMNI